MEYREADLSRVATVPVSARRNKVDPRVLASPPSRNRSFSAFLDSLPDVLAARDFRLVIDAVVAAEQSHRGVVLLLGGHVIKVGLGPLVNSWLQRGIVSHVALNGAAAIHDFELAAFGGTSEDVESGLADGSFGMAEETGAEMNAAGPGRSKAAARKGGIGSPGCPAGWYSGHGSSGHRCGDHPSTSQRGWSRDWSYRAAGFSPVSRLASPARPRWGGVELG